MGIFGKNREKKGMISELIRCESDISTFAPRKVILIGAGAIEGSWEPIYDVMNDTRNNIAKEYKAAFNSKDKNNQIATYLAQVSLQLNSAIIQNFSTSLDIITDEYIGKQLENLIQRQILLQTYSKIIIQISSSLQKTPLLPREQIKDIENEIDDSTGVIVLNWDETIWKRTDKFKNVIQLHGKCSNPYSLILPMETSFEKEFLTRLVKYEKINEGVRYVTAIHPIAFNWLHSAEEIISWGVAYNMYEAELNQLLNSAFYQQNRKPLAKITNINTDESTNTTIAALMNFPREKIKDCL